MPIDNRELVCDIYVNQSKQCHQEKYWVFKAIVERNIHNFEQKGILVLKLKQRTAVEINIGLNRIYLRLMLLLAAREPLILDDSELFLR